MTSLVCRSHPAFDEDVPALPASPWLVIMKRTNPHRPFAQVAPYTSAAQPYVQPVVPFIEKAKPYVPPAVLAVLLLCTPPMLCVLGFVAFVTAPVSPLIPFLSHSHPFFPSSPCELSNMFLPVLADAPAGASILLSFLPCSLSFPGKRLVSPCLSFFSPVRQCLS